MPIITSGIYLPDLRFIPNGIDGHAKNADRYCRNYPQLEKLKNSEATLNSDEFMIVAGRAISASYNGERCFKVAEDNHNPNIEHLRDENKKNNIKIIPYWKINSMYAQTLDEIIANEKKYQITMWRCSLMNLKKKVGFFLNGVFYDNNGRGHEKNAMTIIAQNGWTREWMTGSAQDFLVLEKRAIQLGSGIFNDHIIASKEVYTEFHLDKFCALHGLQGYKYDRI